MPEFRTSLISLAVTYVLAVCAQAQQPDWALLNEELYSIDALRAADKTPFSEVEKRGRALLQRYGDAESQGKIYFTLAEVYAQSGPVVDKTIEYTQKALAHPLDPVKRLQMYVYWGDAIQVSHREASGEQLASARREAVTPYLQGLKEALAHNLPEVTPEMPPAGFFNVEGPSDSPEYLQMKRKHDADIEAQRIARFQQDMIRCRDILTGQIVFLYSREPFATEEIRTLAAKTLQDEHAVQRLMAVVEEAVNERTKKSEVALNPAVPVAKSPNAELDERLTVRLAEFMKNDNDPADHVPGVETKPNWNPDVAMQKLDKPLQERLSAILKDIETVKPGMTRGELLHAFGGDGGLFFRTGRVYVYLTCPLIKVCLKFRAVGELKPGQFESDADVIQEVSKPFLQWQVSR